MTIAGDGSGTLAKTYLNCMGIIGLSIISFVNNDFQAFGLVA